MNLRRIVRSFAVTSLIALLGGCTVDQKGTGPTGPQGPQGPQGVAGVPCAGCVNSASIAPGAVGTAALADGGVTAAKIAAGAVTSAALAPGAVASGTVAAGAVGTTELADSSITTAKLAPGSVDNTVIASATIGTAQLAPGSVDNTIIAPATITGGNIAGATIAGSNIASGTVTGGATGNIAASTITGSNVVAGTITGGTGGNIAASTITASNIVAGTITGGAGGNIASGTIRGSNVDSTTSMTVNSMTANDFVYGSPVAGAFIGYPTECQRGVDQRTLGSGSPYVDVGVADFPGNVFGPSLTITNGNVGVYNFMCPIPLPVPPGATVTLTGGSMAFFDSSAICLVSAELRTKTFGGSDGFGTPGISTVFSGANSSDFAAAPGGPTTKPFPAFTPVTISNSTILYVNAIINITGAGGVFADCRYSGVRVTYTIDRP